MIVPSSIVVLVSSFLAATVNALSVIEQQEDFLNDYTVINDADNYPLFSSPKEFKKHTPELFKNMSTLAMFVLFEKFAGKNPEFDDERVLTHITQRNDWNEYEAVEWTKSIEKKSLENMSDQACELIWNLISLMPESKRNYIKPKCILKSFTFEEYPIQPDYYQYVTPKQLEAIGTSLLETLRTAESGNAELLNKFTLKQFEVLVKRKNCAKINASAINSLDEEFLEKITPECFAQLTELDTASLEGERVRLLRNNIMSKIKPSKQPSDETYRSLRPEQVSNLPNCKGLNISRLGHGAKGLKANCLASYLAGIKSNEEVKFGKKFWRTVPETAFLGIPDNLLRVLNRLDADNEITDKITAALLSNEAACKVIKSDAKLGRPTSSTPFHVSLECFKNLKPKVQAYILTIGARLDAKILSATTARHAKDWVITDNNGNEQSGVMVLNHIRSESASLSDIFANMSSSIGAGPTHICAAIESQDQLEDLKYNNLFDRNCILSLKFPLGQEAMKKLPHIFFNQPYEKISSNLDADFFRNIKKDDLKAISSEGSFCAKVPQDNFALIPLTALEGLSAKCLEKLPYQDALTAEQVVALDEGIFAGFKAVDFAKLNIKLLTPAQLAAASSKVEDAKENVASLFTETFLATTTVDHFAKITARQWAIVPVAGYKAFSKEKFAAILSDAMVDMSLDQVKEIPVAVLKGITKDQAEKIGINNKDPKTNTILAFKGILAELSPEVRAVLIKRGLNGAAAMMAVPASAMLAAMTAAILAF